MITPSRPITHPRWSELVVEATALVGAVKEPVEVMPQVVEAVREPVEELTRAVLALGVAMASVRADRRWSVVEEGQEAVSETLGVPHWVSRPFHPCQ